MHSVLKKNYDRLPEEDSLELYEKVWRGRKVYENGAWHVGGREVCEEIDRMTPLGVNSNSDKACLLLISAMYPTATAPPANMFNTVPGYEGTVSGGGKWL